MAYIRTHIRLMLAAVCALGMALAGAPALLAQEATPVATPVATPMATGVLTAAIHTGTCADFGEVVFDLGTLQTAEERYPDDDVRGSAMSGPVFQVDADADDVDFGALLDDESHALVVHGANGEPVACGDLAGVVHDDELTVALRPINNSGFAGVAILEEDEATLGIGSDEVEVDVTLFEL